MKLDKHLNALCNILQYLIISLKAAEAGVFVLISIRHITLSHEGDKYER